MRVRRHPERRPRGTSPRLRRGWRTRAHCRAGAHGLARADVDRLAVDSPGGDALESVDRFLKAIMAVGRRHPGLRGNITLEERDAAVGRVGINEEADAQGTDR